MIRNRQFCALNYFGENLNFGGHVMRDDPRSWAVTSPDMAPPSSRFFFKTARTCCLAFSACRSFLFFFFSAIKKQKKASKIQPSFLFCFLIFVCIPVSRLSRPSQLCRDEKGKSCPRIPINSQSKNGKEFTNDDSDVIVAHFLIFCLEK